MNIETSEGITPSVTAIFSGSEEAVCIPLVAGAQLDPAAVWMAANNGYERIMDRLLAHGASPNARHPGGGLALVEAAKNGHVEIIRLLLLYGAT